MNLRAQNLYIFVQLAEGIDAETWRFHLKRGDYSNWLRRALKDPELADEIQRIETDEALSDQDSRIRVKQTILHKHTAPV